MAKFNSSAPNYSQNRAESEAEDNEDYMVPEELLHLIEGFIERREQELKTLRACIQARDFATIRSIAHKLKGNGAGYGLPQISQLGQALENAATERDPDLANQQIDSLQVVVGRVKAHFH